MVCYSSIQHNGLNDWQETQLYETYPYNPDSDGDGRNDCFEVDNGLDPLDADIKWTIMVYISADNDIEADCIDDFNEMETVGCNDDITIIVQMDRIDGYDDSNGDWTDTRRYLVSKDTDTENINSYLIKNLGEKNMGSPSTLNDFQNWGRTNFHAERYALILLDHGMGIEGCCLDMTDSSDEISLPDMKEALPNGQEIDIIGFDACYMGVAEVFYQIRQKAEIVIGSEDIIPNEGWPYDSILNQLKQSPTMTGSEFASAIVNNYFNFYQNEGTLCAVDLTKFSSLTSGTAQQINELSMKLLSAMQDSTYGEYYIDIFEQALSYPKSYSGIYLDLYYLAEWLSDSDNVKPQDEESHAYLIRQKAAWVKSYLTDGEQKCIINEKHRGEINAKGITIFLPKSTEKWNDNYYIYENLDWTSDTNWDNMLDYIR